MAAARRRKSSNVASIWGNNTDIPAPEPDKDVVEQLEGLLARARSGQILGLHFACVEPGRNIATGFSGQADKGGMLMAIVEAYLRYGRRYIEDE